MSNVQALEFILFYVFPRGDVNPLAHRLLERFKNIPTVLEAPIYDLVKVEGMGIKSAKKLNLLLNIFYRYTEEKAAKQEKISTFGEIYDFVESLLRFKFQEELHIIAINKNGVVVGTRCIGKGNLSSVTVNLEEIALFITTYRANGAIIAHNHPCGSCKPSSNDIISNEKLENNFNFVNCKLIDNVIVGIDGIFSIKDNCIKRTFIENEEYYSGAINELKK